MDITKCTGTRCPHKKTCYRFTAKADKYQSYFVGTPMDKKTKECEHYWKVKDSKDSDELDKINR